MSKWYPFDEKKGYRQKRPPIYKLVIVKATTTTKGMPDCIVVAYRKDSAGEKSLPYFVYPGCDNIDTVYAWRDCLDIPKDENLWDSGGVW